MADILVRGMEMPKTCSQCPLCYDYMMCSILEVRFSRMDELFDCCDERLADCPLIELPPHGDLTDRDAIVAHYRECERNLGSDRHLELLTVHDWIEEGIVYDLLSAPVVIASNKGGN